MAVDDYLFKLISMSKSLLFGVIYYSWRYFSCDFAYVHFWSAFLSINIKMKIVFLSLDVTTTSADVTKYNVPRKVTSPGI